MARRGRAGSLLTRCWVAYVTSMGGWPLDLRRYGWNFAPPNKPCDTLEKLAEATTA